MADEEAQLAALAKKPIDEQISSKLWKGRKQGYVSMMSRLQSAGASEVQVAYARLAPKIVSDSNVAAQDVACDVVLLLLENSSASLLVEEAASLATALTKQAFNSRPSTVQKAIEIILRLIEIGSAPDVIPPCAATFSHKVPKIALAAIDTVLAALQSFGHRVVPAKLFVGALLPIFDAKDKKVRDKAKDLVLELAKWLKPTDVRSSIISRLRDAQQVEMEAALQLQEEAAATARPSRHVRGAAPDVVSAVSGGEEVELSNDGPKAHPPVFEEADLLELPAVDVVAGLPKTFWQDVAAAKWATRRDALARLSQDASVPRAAGDNWFDVVSALKKVLQKDSNAACVAEAAACVAAIATSVRKPFAPFARQTLVPICLEKLKDKSSAVQQRSLEAVTAMHAHCVRLTDISDAVLAALKAPSPQAKQHVLAWLSACFASEPTTGLSKLQGSFLPPLVVLSADAVPDVRDAAVNAIAAIAQSAGGLPSINAYIGKMDDRRRKQVEAAVNGTSATPISSTNGEVGSHVQRPPSRGRPATPSGATARSKSVTQTRSLGTAPAARTQSRPAQPRSKLTPGVPGGALCDDPIISSNMNKDTAAEYITDTFSPGTAEQLKGVAWKGRLAGMGEVMTKLRSDGAQACCVRTMHALGQLPGWKDTNFQVVAKMCEACCVCSDHLSGLLRQDTGPVVAGVVDRLADAKVKPRAVELLSSLAEASSLANVSRDVFAKAKGHKNPKVLQEAAAWITLALQEFAGGNVSSGTAVPWVKELLAHANPGIRDAGVDLAVELHRHFHSAVLDMLEPDVKPTLMAKLKDACATPSAAAVAPSRTERRTAPAALTTAPVSRGSGPAGHPVEALQPASAGVEVVDAADGAPSPRTDISPLITDKLTMRLGNGNWKERKAAVEEVEQMLADAGDKIVPTLGGLLPALLPRLADSNRNLAAQVIKLLARLVRSIGRGAECHARGILSPVLRNAGDAKPAVRGAVHECLLAYVAECGWVGLRDPVASVLASPKTTGPGKVTVLESFRDALQLGRLPRSSDAAAPIVHACAHGLSDKGIEPRKAAASCLDLLCEDAGVAVLARSAAGDLNPALRTSVTDHLGKHGGAPGAVPARPGTAPGQMIAAPAPSAGARKPRRAEAAPTGLRRPGARERATHPSASVAAAPPASSAPRQDEGHESLVLLAPKEERDSRARTVPVRSLKFELRMNEESTVQALLAPYLASVLAAQMFSPDFKQHVAACDSLLASMEAYATELSHLLDLFLRWAVVRFAEEKNQSLLKVQAFVSKLLSLLHAAGIEASDNDANVFLPCVCEKVGHNQDRARSGYRDLLTRFRALYPSSRFVLFLSEGMESKNTKSRADCCNQLAEVLRERGPGVLPRGARAKRTGSLITRLAASTAERDCALRQAALAALMVVYEQEGARIWQMLGDLPVQQHDHISDRIRAVDRELASRGCVAGAVAPTMATAGAGARDVSVEDAGNQQNTLPPASAGPEADLAALAPAPKSGGPMPAVADPVLSAPAAPAARTSEEEGGSAPWMAPRPPSEGGQPGKQALSAPASVTASPPRQALAVSVSSAGMLAPGALPSPAGPCAEGGYLARFEEAMEELARSPEQGCIEAIKAVFYTLAAISEGPGAAVPIAPEEAAAVEGRASELGQLLIARTHVLKAEASALLSGGSPNPLRGLRYMLNCVWKLYDIKGFAAQMDVAATSAIVSEVLAQLSNHRSFQDTYGGGGQELLHVMNVIMGRIMDRVPRNTAFAALLGCFSHVPDIVMQRGPSAEHCFRELALRCLIKLTKLLDRSEVDIGELLLDMDRYFCVIGPKNVRKLVNQSDRPIMMVKTMLHELCKTKKLAVLTAARTAFRGRSTKPLVVVYVELNLRSFAEMGLIDAEELERVMHEGDVSGGGACVPMLASDNGSGSGSPSEPADGPSAALGSPPSARGAIPAEPVLDAAGAARDVASERQGDGVGAASGAMQPLRTSNAVNVATGLPTARLELEESARKQVAEIFTKIGANATTYQGLEELFHFLDAHPEVPIEELMQDTTEGFKRYIRKGLVKVAKKERKRRQFTYPRTQLSVVPEDQGSRDSSCVGELERASIGSDPNSLQERFARVEHAHS